MALKGTQAMIEEIEAAITKVLTSQSYTIGDASVQRAKLKTLYEARDKLLNDYNREQGTTPTVSQAYFGDAGD